MTTTPWQARQRFDGLLERLAACGLFHCCGIIQLAEAEMLGDIEIASHMPRPGAPVLDQAGKASLPGVEIDRGNGLARLDQGNRNMHRNGGLAEPPFSLPTTTTRADMISPSNSNGADR